MRRHSYLETPNFSALWARLPSGAATVDITRRIPGSPGSHAELIDLLAPACAETQGARVEVLCQPQDYYLFEDLQAAGFRFTGYLALARAPQGSELPLWMGPQRVRRIPPATAARASSGTVLRSVLEFGGRLLHDSTRMSAEFLRDCRTRDRFFSGISTVRPPDGLVETLGQPAAPNRRPPPPPTASDKPFSAVVRARASADGFSARGRVTHDEVRGLIWDSYCRREDGRRPFAAAGGIGDYRIYIAVRNVLGLNPGLYRAAESDPTLTRIDSRTSSRAIDAAAFSQPTAKHAAAWLIITAIPGRLLASYGCRAQRFMYLDVGGLLQQLHLSASSREFGFRTIGGFDDRLMESLLDVSGLELAMACAAIGR